MAALYADCHASVSPTDSGIVVMPGRAMGKGGRRDGGGGGSNIDGCLVGVNIDMINVNAAFCWLVGAPPPLSPLCRLISITAGQGASGGRCRRKGPQEVSAGGTDTMAALIMVFGQSTGCLQHPLVWLCHQGGVGA